eukprot:SAG31_NODE_19621_length_596_cov_2.567404_1_plen_57_part_10
MVLLGGVIFHFCDPTSLEQVAKMLPKGAPFCCIDTILDSFLTLVGGNFRTSWQQVYR